MTMPAWKPGRSEQSVGTPRVFLDAVEARFGTITLDVAASPHNAVCERFIDEAQNGLTTPWDPDGLNWCNPPFARIAPWVEKAYAEARDNSTRSLLLLMASVGSNWWRDWVHDKAFVYLLNGRMTFVGHSTPFPKDLVLLEYCNASVYSEGLPYYEVWDWRKPWVDPITAHIAYMEIRS